MQCGIDLVEKGNTMDFITKSKRPGMDCSIDVYFERLNGIPAYINDKTTWKMVLLDRGSFTIEQNSKFRVIKAPAALALNEKANLKIVASDKAKSRIIFFKPTFLRDEFTYEAINSMRYEKFLSAVDNSEKTGFDKYISAISDDVNFERIFLEKTIYHDALYLLNFIMFEEGIGIWELTSQEYEFIRRLTISVEYDLTEQPDNFWILRVRHFLKDIIFMGIADFYHNYREEEIFSDYLVASVVQYCRENLASKIDLSVLLKEFSVNKNQLNAAFDKEVGMTCMEYIERMRINLAKRMLDEESWPIGEIGEKIGYEDNNYFSKVFKKHIGMTPSEYRQINS